MKYVFIVFDILLHIALSAGCVYLCFCYIRSTIRTVTKR